MKKLEGYRQMLPILSLAFNNNMTASRIFFFLNQQQINVGSSWSTVRLILDQWNKAKISVQQVERIFLRYGRRGTT